jgi:hypothetical protein
LSLRACVQGNDSRRWRITLKTIMTVMCIDRWWPGGFELFRYFQNILQNSLRVVSLTFSSAKQIVKNTTRFPSSNFKHFHYHRENTFVGVKYLTDFSIFFVVRLSPPVYVRVYFTMAKIKIHMFQLLDCNKFVTATFGNDHLTY